ncbi:MAG TPA: [citrate (pro-3S)-lyase] ligase [Prolixibacteraceae bacterium]|jgi:[citrate (pro-3S)-lyase] ligase|nr:[citrate (pro-3S)-lyase] ligase [Prolixibacteraceae bacterium]
MTFEDTDFRQETLDLDNPFDVKLVKDFLLGLGFEFIPSEVECSMIVYNLKGELVGTGSHLGRILKYVAVAPKFRDTTAFALIVTYMTEKLLKIYKHTFVFTRPENSVRFVGLGYTEIASAPPLFTVLEFGFESIFTYQDYLKSLKVPVKTSAVAAIVMNCNPFTNGHQFLIEKAAAENEIVYLFVVEEDLSAFPFQVRWELIRNGIAHLKNVVMVRGGMYIVSGTIFPAYFLKNETISDVMQKQAELDVRTFANYVVPVLGIKKRYVGTEIYCPTTSAYNLAMKTILPSFGVEVVEVTRKANHLGADNSPDYISASKVRDAIKQDKLDEVLDFLPDSTRDFLYSDASLNIRQKIKSDEGRH